MAETNVFVNVGFYVFLFASTALILYWAATVKNDIENNPEKDS